MLVVLVVFKCENDKAIHNHDHLLLCSTCLLCMACESVASVERRAFVPMKGAPLGSGGHEVSRFLNFMQTKASRWENGGCLENNPFGICPPPPHTHRHTLRTAGQNIAKKSGWTNSSGTHTHTHT